MSVQLLDKTRKINKLLHNNHSTKVVFNDICEVLMETLSSNILVISKKGKVLGISLCPGVEEITELIEDKVGGYTKWRILSTSCGVMLSNFVKPNPHRLISGAQVTSNIPPVCSDACMAVRKGLHQVIYLTMFFVPSVSLCRIHF